MLTAPSGPMTAISAVGHARLMSARRCLLPMTMYAPPYALRVIYRHFGYGSLRIRVDELCAMANDAPVLLVRSWQVSWHVHQGDNGNVESIAEAHEARCFVGGVYIQYARQVSRLLRHYANGIAGHTCETYDYIGREEPLDFHEIAVIHDSEDDLLHVVGLYRVVGDHIAQRIIRTGRIIKGDD